jgi:hypothetical protein
VIFETKKLHLHACTEKAQYVRPLATHPTAPPRFSSIDHGHQPKSDTSRQTGRGQTKQECEPNETEFSLGDWNAGKEEDSLPGPNFGVPRDLFRGTMSEKTRQVVQSLCNNISRQGVNIDVRRGGNGSDHGSVIIAFYCCSVQTCHSHYTIMSTSRRRLVNRIEDATLGAFGNLQPSETLNHLIRYLSTWNGSECVYLSFSIRVNSTEMCNAANYSW